jgi:hypothetical protein
MTEKLPGRHGDVNHYRLHCSWKGNRQRKTDSNIASEGIPTPLRKWQFATVSQWSPS